MPAGGQQAGVGQGGLRRAWSTWSWGLPFPHLARVTEWAEVQGQPPVGWLWGATAPGGLSHLGAAVLPWLALSSVWGPAQIWGPASYAPALLLRFEPSWAPGCCGRLEEGQGRCPPPTLPMRAPCHSPELQEEAARAQSPSPRPRATAWHGALQSVPSHGASSAYQGSGCPLLEAWPGGDCPGQGQPTLGHPA